MAAQDYFGAVQQLYISYFGRPADPTGLQNMAAALDAIGAPKEFGALQQQVQADRAGTTALSRLVNTFNNSAESNALYGTDNSVTGIQKFVAAIYQNVLGREADIGGFNFWVGEITAGRLTKANAAASITAAAMTNTTAQGLLDKATVEKKLAVASAFTTALDTPTEIISYSGDAAAATARTLLGAVTGTTDVAGYTSSINTAIENMVAVANPGQTFALTAGIDNFIGTNGNDNFNVVVNADVNPMGALDVIEGGAGRDTLNIVDTSGTALSLGGLTVRNVENMVVSTNSAFNAFDISTTGVTTATLSSSAKDSTDTNTVTAGANTNVTLTSAGTANATVTGGKAVTLNGAGTNTVNGAALTSVTVNGGTAAVSNDTASTVAAGTTLTSVTLNNVKGANTIAGRGVTTVNLSGVETAGTTVAISNSSTATSKPLTLNVTGVTGAAVTANGATAVTVNAATKSDLTLNASAATAATVGGAGDVKLNLAGATALTSLTSTATGVVELNGLASTLVSITGGAGSERFTTTQNAKVAFDLGAGNDIVTVNSALAAGSTINLGAGNDKLIKGATGSIAASTTTATTVIDGGAGVDTVAAGFINAGNANLFTNFEVLGLDASTLDVSLVTGTTFTGLELLAGGGTYTNITNAQGLAVNTAGVTGTTTLTFNNVTGAADAYTVTFGAETAGTASAPAAISAGTVSLAGIEAINVVSGAAAGVATNAITLADAAAQTVTVTGNQALNLSFASGFGNTSGKGVTSIDASAATAKVTISTANVTAASAGLTVKGGTAGDSITLAGKATVDAGAGDDTIIVNGAFATTLTGGAGKDTFNVKAATGVDAMTTINDFVAADDKIVFNDGATFNTTRVNVSTATTFEQALNLAAAGTTGNDITWFQYGGNTYIVEDNSAAATFGAGDVLVKLVGTIDLSTATSSIVSAAVVAPVTPV